MRSPFIIQLVALVILSTSLPAQKRINKDSALVAENYIKLERMIPMRDGVKLFTSIYIPKDENEKYPFLIKRTPYSSSPYGENNLDKRWLGPNKMLCQEKYIFVTQDVRGRYKSEGKFEDMTPAIDNKKSKQDVDESSDTFDTIEWLLKNIKNNNGRVGIYGVSYLGFYAAASLPDAHPAIKAVSPQAPISDQFIGDDVNHNGAFFLMDTFDFSAWFLGERINSGTDYEAVFSYESKDAYSFYKNVEPLKKTNDSAYFNKKEKIWSEYLEHDTYDDYWKSRNLRPHLKNIKPAVLVVGGWFDAEDLFGTLNTFKAIKEQSPDNTNVRLVMGPWRHGSWFAIDPFGYPTYNIKSQNQYFQQEIETKFFNYYLKDKGSFDLPQAMVFNTGVNQWEEHKSWPPVESQFKTFYLNQGKMISDKPSSTTYDAYVSDPENPVPYTAAIRGHRNSDYMVEDQRFAEQRIDVLTYKTDTLTSDITVEGTLKVDLFISTTGTDGDFVVKLIDVLPDNEPSYEESYRLNGVRHTNTYKLAGVERLERAEVFRSKFRNSYEKPEALVPGKITEIKFEMNDIAHTFKRGHRIMVQVQSSWFPLVDINPQKFIDIPNCNKSDFQKATIHVYHNSSITLPVIK